MKKESSPQELMQGLFNECGELWERDKILLKLTEELGELAQAFRKKTRTDQIVEIGDVAFAVLALCIREKFDFSLALDAAIDKHRRFVASLKCTATDIAITS